MSQFVKQGGKQKDVKYFSLDDNSGQLHTRKRLDREEVCPKMESCLVELTLVCQVNRKRNILKVGGFGIQMLEGR